MRKIIAITSLCFFSVLFKNEKAICKSNCQQSCNTIPKHLSLQSDADKANDLKPYDGFFIKL